MVWYICFFTALILLLAALWLWLRRRYGELRYGLILAVLLTASWVSYLPLFLQAYDPWTLLFAPIGNTMRVIALDAFHLDRYDELKALLPQGNQLFRGCYLLLMGLLELLLPILSAVAAYTILLRCYASFRTFLINRRRRPLYVLTGWSDETALLAKSIREAEPRCDLLIADCEEKPKNHPNLQALGCVFHGDGPAELRLRHRGGKDIWFFCIGPDEDKNLNDALALIRAWSAASGEEQKKTHVLLRSSLPDCDTMIDSTAKGALDVRILNESEEAAYGLLQAQPLFRGAREGRICLLLAGFGPVNQSVLRTAVWCGQLSGYRLQIRVCGLDAEADFKAFLNRYPALRAGGRYDVQYTACTDALQLSETLREQGKDATYAVIDCGDDRRNLEQALLLRQQLYRDREDFRHAPPIFLYVRSADKAEMIRGLRTSDSREDRRVSYGLVPFGFREGLYSFEALVNAPLEALARNVHLVYSDIFSDGNLDVAAALEQYNLFEVKKRSNRANAMHIRYKLALLGLDYTDDPRAREVRLEDYLTRERLAALTLSEHDRWMAFLETEGWSEATIPQVEAYRAAGLAPGRHESAILKLHPFICDFNELPARSEALHQKDATIYDELLIARIPEILHDRWGVAGRSWRIVRAQSEAREKR